MRVCDIRRSEVVEMSLKSTGKFYSPVDFPGRFESQQQSLPVSGLTEAACSGHSVTLASWTNGKGCHRLRLAWRGTGSPAATPLWINNEAHSQLLAHYFHYIGTLLTSHHPVMLDLTA